MTFTTQQANFTAELQQVAAETLILRDKLENLSARWVQNDFFNEMDEVEVAAGVPGITKGEIIEAINAINAVLTALGDNSTGQAVNLIKMKV
jgi:hypothetical protein